MNYSTQGYRTNSPDRNNPYNVINSNIISMKGVSQPITAIPIINGKPDYSKRQVLHPNQGDFVFEGAEAVLELPYARDGFLPNFNFDNSVIHPKARTGLSYMGEIDINGFLPNFNFNTSVIPQTTAPANPTGNSGTVGNMDFNFYTGVEQGSVLPQALNNPFIHQKNLQIQQNNLDYQRQVDLYKNQYSQPDPIQRQLYSTQEQLRQQLGIQDPLQSQTDWNNAVKRVQDKSTTPNTSEQQEQTGSWWDMFNNIDRTHDLSSSLTRAGYGLGWNADNYDWASEQQRDIAKKGNTLATIGAVGNTLLKAGKDFFSGMAAANREQQAVNEYHEEMNRRLRDRNTYYATLQEGGQIQDEKVLTGGYTTGIPENAPITPTAEVERNEFLLQNDGSVQQVLGNTHEQGGELMDLEAGTRVISDHLKIGGEFSKRLNKDFDLNTRAKETYSKVVEKYRKKIGLQKVLDEYQGVIGKIKDQEETEHTQTREINLSFLAQRVQELEAQKAPLEEELSKFTEFVFQEQESKKAESQPTSSYQDGGEVEKILQTYSQVTGIPYEQLLQEFNSLSEQEQQVLLQEIVQELQGAQQQQQQTDPEQLIQAYAQATGTDPNQILQQLQQMSPEQQQQALAQMEQELQQSQQQYREGGNVPKYQDGRMTLPILPNNIYGFGLPNFTFNPPESMLATTPTTTERTIPARVYNAVSGSMNPEQWGEYLRQYDGSANYDYGDWESTQNRLQYLFDTYGMDKSNYDFSSQMNQQQLEQGFGEMQKFVNENYSDVIGHYMANRSNTKQDLDFYIEKGLVSPEFLKEKGVKLDNKGKAVRGIREQNLARSVDDAIYEEVNKNAEEKDLLQDLIEYRQVGFNDNKAYYRAPEIQQIDFNTQAEADKFITDNGYTQISDNNGQPIYYSNKEGLYFIPTVKEQPKTDEEDTTKTDEETTPTTGTTTTNPYTQESNQQINLPWSEIDQRIPFPMGMDIGRMQSVSPINLRPVNVSVEPALNEINRQVAFANQMVNFAPDSTRAAQIANLVATGTDASNQAITANNLQNAQLNQQVEQFNELQIGAADRMNTELAENYTERFLRTKAALESQQAGWHQYMNRLAAQQQQNQFNRNLAQSIYPNMRLNPDGTITGVGNFLEIYQNFLNQQEQEGKTQTGKKGKTQITQKGGTIKDHLRLTMFKK